MLKKTLPLFATILLAAAPHARAQADNPPADPAANESKNDVPQPNRFWQANVGGGTYMVSLERISAISRHKYLLDGSLIVDEVTVDALGQALVRFYFITPVTDAPNSSAAGEVASRIADHARDLAEKTAGHAGTDIQNMVVKKFPDTTHARCIEYRVLSEEELTSLYKSVRTAWETNRGRKFTIR